MRLQHAVLILLAGFLVLPNLTWSQGPGGGGGRGGRGMPNPEDIFYRFSEGKDVIIVSTMDPAQQARFQMMASRFGLTGDQITLEQFSDAFTKMVATFGQGGGANGGPPGGGGPGMGNPNFGGGPGGMGNFGGGPGGGPGGPQRRRNQDAGIEARFHQLDLDEDGMLSANEMPEDLLREREIWDTNHDGFIDLNEYKGFMQERMARNQDQQDNGDLRPGDLANDLANRNSDDNRPAVYRAGKLPRNLPEWFIRLDREGDNDGQVGLWEAKNDPKVLADFAKMDLNGDGLLTAEEVLRWMASQRPKNIDVDMAGGRNSRGGGPNDTAGGGGRGNNMAGLQGGPGGFGFGGGQGGFGGGQGGFGFGGQGGFGGGQGGFGGGQGGFGGGQGGFGGGQGGFGGGQGGFGGGQGGFGGGQGGFGGGRRGGGGGGPGGPGGGMMADPNGASQGGGPGGGRGPGGGGPGGGRGPGGGGGPGGGRFGAGGGTDPQQLQPGAAIDTPGRQRGGGQNGQAGGGGQGGGRGNRGGGGGKN